MLKIFKFIPLQLTCFLIVGILLRTQFIIEPWILFTIVLCLLAALGISYLFSNKSIKQNFHFYGLTYLLCVLLGFLSVTIQDHKLSPTHYIHKLNQTHELQVDINEVLKPSLYHTKYVVSIKEMDGGSVSGKLLLNLSKDSVRTPKVDDLVFLKGTLVEINKPLNPFYFDYSDYLRKQQIYHQVTLNSKDVLLLSSNNNSLKGVAANFRKHVNNALENQGFKNDELAVMNALLLGQRNDVSKELLQDYANAGAIHILALSGLHVGIILLLLNFMLMPIERFKHGKLFKLILIVVFLWSFAFVAGLSPSIVRAVTMFTAVAIGWQSKRRTNVYHTLIISMFVLLLIRPSFLFEVGFQLSYLAVFSIVWVQPKLYKLWIPKWKLVDYFWKLLTVSIAAQFGILPLSLFYFHQFPGLFFLSNLVIIPILGVILAGGFLIIALSLLDALPSILFRAYNILIKSMNKVIQWVAEQESFLFQDIPFSFSKMMVVYLIIFTSILFFERKNFNRLLMLLVSTLLVQSVFIYEKHKKFSQNEFVVFHKSGASIISKLKDKELEVFHSLNPFLIEGENILKHYKLGHGGVKVIKNEVIPRIYQYQETDIFIIDSLGLYQITELHPAVVLLRESPKVNLNRVIELLQPKLIVADGSNYKSFIKRWEQTSAQQKTPFHYTGQKGAFILKE